MTTRSAVPATTAPVAWLATCRADDADRQAGRLTDDEYWARVHKRDVAIAALPAHERQAINSFTG
jgi:hypothetical protein